MQKLKFYFKSLETPSKVLMKHKQKLSSLYLLRMLILPPMALRSTWLSYSATNNNIVVTHEIKKCIAKVALVLYEMDSEMLYLCVHNVSTFCAM